jgi:hypothetical protein
MSNASPTMVRGLAVKAFADSLADELKPILAKYGYAGPIGIDDWYPRRDYLAMIDEVAQSTHIVDMISVGLQTGHYALLPAGVDSVEGALQNLDASYRLGHRYLPKDEGLDYRRMDEVTHHIIARTPYPINLMYGIVFGIVERFAPEGARFSVFTEEEGGHPAFRVVMR